MTISNQGIALSFTRETNQSCDKFPCARLVAVNDRSSFRLGYPASTNSLPPPFWMIALQKSENDDGDNTGRYYDTSYGKEKDAAQLVVAGKSSFCVPDFCSK